MQERNNQNKEFRVNLHLGEENVTISVPSGQDLPNEMTIYVGSSRRQLKSVYDPLESHQEVLEEQETYAQGTVFKKEENLVQEEGSMPIIPVEVSEDTEDVVSVSPSSLEEVFNTRYAYKAHLYNHMCNALSKHVEFSDLTKPNLMRIKDYLASRVSPNTVVLYCSVIKALMNLYSDEGVFKCKGFSQVLKHKRVPSMNVYLNEEEIHKIEMYKPKNRGENDVKIKFLIEAYTGARLSDVEKMSAQDIRDGYLTYISKKTSIVTKIPVHKNLERLLEAKRGKGTSRSVYSRIIKDICKKCGIDEEISIFYHGKQQVEPKWKFIGSHTARRSFATNLALRNVPIQVISKMMGHTDTKMTEKYIIANIESIDDHAMEFFK